MPAPDDHHHGSAIAERLLSRLKLRETFVVTFATLAIASISIAALPSLFGKAPATEALSHTDHSLPDIQDSNVSGSYGPRGDDVIAVPATAPVAFTTATAAVTEQLITPGMHGDDTRVVTGEATDLAMTGDNMPVPVNTARTISKPVPVGNINEGSSSEQHRQFRFVASFQTPGDVETLDENAIAGDPSEETQATSHDGLMLARQQYAADDSQLASGDINRALSSQQQLSVTAGSAQSAVADGMVGVTDAIQDEAIVKLLSLGQQSLDDYHLLTPEEDNAYGYFRAVLRLDPANEDAYAGIQEIVDLYVTITRKAVDRHDIDRAGQYVERGLSIQPGNHELLALKDGIDRRESSASNRTTPVARRVGARDHATHDGMMSRITTFFNKRKAEAKRGEVKVPPGWDS